MKIKDLLSGILRKGIRIGYSDGKPFDPRGQERTDAVENILKRKKEEK